MGNHDWLRCYRGSRSHVNIAFIMEEEHGHSNDRNSTHTTSTHGSVDGINLRADVGVDKETDRKPIPLSQRIITDCC